MGGYYKMAEQLDIEDAIRAAQEAQDRPVQKSGEELAVEGMERAVAHANRVEPRWSDRAYSFLLSFITRFDPPWLTIEQVKFWSYRNGLPQPPSPGSWGSVTRRAKAEGHIVFDKYEPSQNASQHGKPVIVWRVK
jgi:hypothetical protein